MSQETAWVLADSTGKPLWHLAGTVQQICEQWGAWGPQDWTKENLEALDYTFERVEIVPEGKLSEELREVLRLVEFAVMGLAHDPVIGLPTGNQVWKVTNEILASAIEEAELREEK